MAGSTDYAKAILGLDSMRFKAGVKSAKRAWMGFSKDLTRSIVPMAGALGAAGLGAAIIKTGATFEQQMKNIEAVTRSSKQEMLAMETAARQLGAQTSYSASQVGEGMTVIAKATGSAMKSVQGIESVLKLAGSEGAEMATTAELMISSMNAFGIAFSDSARVANVFAATAQNTRMSVDRLNDSMKYAAPLGREVGLGLEDTAAALGVLVDSGLEASQAGTNLRAALVDIIKAGGDMEKALKGVSIETDGLEGVLRALSMAGIEGEEVFKTFNVRGANAIAILQRQVMKFEDLREKITGTNAAWEAYGTQQDSTLMAWERVKSALSEVSIAVFQTFGTTLKGALDDLAGWILGARRTIAEFAANVVTNMRKAVTWVIEFGRVADDMARAVAAGFANIDFGAMVKTWIATGGRIGGEALAWQFRSGFETAWADAGETMRKRVADAMVGIEEDHKAMISRIGAIDVASTFKAPGVKEETWNAARELGSEAAKGLKHGLSMADLGIPVGKLKTSLLRIEEEHERTSMAAAQLWGVAFDWITAEQLSMSERFTGILQGMLQTMTSMFQRMIAEAIATRVNIEQALSGVGVGGLLGLGLGTSLLAGALRTGSAGYRSSTGDALSAFRNARLPQLAAAGGGGGLRLEAHIHIDRGSILYARDEMGVREIAERFNHAIQKTVQQAYRE